MTVTPHIDGAVQVEHYGYRAIFYKPSWYQLIEWAMKLEKIYGK